MKRVGYGRPLTLTLDSGEHFLGRPRYDTSFYDT